MSSGAPFGCLYDLYIYDVNNFVFKFYSGLVPLPMRDFCIRKPPFHLRLRLIFVLRQFLILGVMFIQRYSVTFLGFPVKFCITTSNKDFCFILSLLRYFGMVRKATNEVHNTRNATHTPCPSALRNFNPF